MIMFKKITHGWQLLRSHYWLALIFDVAAILLLFALIHSWQMRHLLSADSDALAPDFELTSLAGEQVRLSQLRGQKAVLFFFAPWCGVCNASIGNLQDLHLTSGDKNLRVMAIAMDYAALEDVRWFADKHDLTLPVLLGNAALIRTWKLRGYPTYYVVDEQGRVRQRSIGYATELGLRWRTG